MATTKAKESPSLLKEKRTPSSNSHSTITKRSTKPSTAPLDKQIPNYLKPTISFNHLKSDAPHKPTLSRRRSFEKPQSPSKLPKQMQSSPSRLHKAGSPASRDKALPFWTSSLPVKTTISSKPISERTSKTPRDTKTHPKLFAKSVKKNSSTASTPNKVANPDMSKVETEPQVKETSTNMQEVEVEAENVSELDRPCDDNEHEHEHHREFEESDDKPDIQANDEKVIPRGSEEEAIPATHVEVEKREPREEKTKDEHEEEENSNQDESNNIGSQAEEHSATEVKEKEEEGGVIEDHVSENKKEEMALEENEEDERGKSEDDIDLREEQDEAEEDEDVEAKTESTLPIMQQAGAREGKKEGQAYNDVIEETASKLLETRKNKVRALAGAFQTVIDYQTSSK